MMMKRQRKIELMLISAANVANGEPVLTGPVADAQDPPITEEEMTQTRALIAAVIVGYTVSDRAVQALLVTSGLGVMEAGMSAANRRRPGQ